MSKITIVVNGHSYKTPTHDAFGPLYLSTLINNVFNLIGNQQTLSWLHPDENLTHHTNNYQVFDMDGKTIEPFLISMRDCHLKPELAVVTVNKPVGWNG